MKMGQLTENLNQFIHLILLLLKNYFFDKMYSSKKEKISLILEVRQYIHLITVNPLWNQPVFYRLTSELVNLKCLTVFQWCFLNWVWSRNKEFQILIKV